MHEPGPLSLKLKFINNLYNLKKTLIFIIFLLIIGLISYIICYQWAASAPVESIAQERRILSEAYRAEADIYAPEMMAKAEIHWKETLREWHEENKKSAFLRDYTKVGLLAAETIKIAKQAIIASQAQKDSLRESVHLEIIIVQEMIKKFKVQYEEIALDQIFNHNLVTSELLMFESEAAYQRNDFFDAARKIKQAYRLIGQSESDMVKRLKEYFAQIPIWQSWALETINRSKEDSSLAIIIDKTERRCKIFENGELKIEFPAEFGANWMGHKKFLGDNATPEGSYHVKEKKEGKKTNYYLALEIDYPNVRDVRRFLRAKARGKIPANAEIGELIEIHGSGGEGRNWTNGCIALQDKDMELVYQLAEVGTPVTIVGALHAGLAVFK